MIHQYQNNGYNIVLDVNSGAVHVVDQEAYDVIAVLNEMNAEHTPETLKAPETETVLKEKLGDRYTEEDLKDILDAVTELTEQGRLFTKDIYENLIGIVKQRKTVVKALCLHIAHDCNLACQYCFAEAEGISCGTKSCFDSVPCRQILPEFSASIRCQPHFQRVLHLAHIFHVEQRIMKSCCL